MTVYQWLSATGGDWKTGADWDTGTAPDNASADVTIETTGSYTLGVAASESFVANTITLDDYYATLQVAGSLQTSAGLLVHYGTLDITGQVTGPIIIDEGGVLLQSGTAPFTLSSSQLSLNGGVVTFLDTATGTADVSVPAGKLFQGQGTIADATNYQASTADPPPALPVLLTNDGTMEAAPPAGVTTLDPLAFTVGSFDNNGVIASAGNELLIESSFDNAAGATLEGTGTASIVIDEDFSNAGLISVDGGSLLLEPQGTWVNSGKIVVNNASLTLGGDESLADLGSISVTGFSTVILVGTLENAGGTLGAAPAELHGMVLDGLIKGGTLDAAALGLSVGYSGALDDVTLINGLTLASGNLMLTDGSNVYSDAAAHTLATIDVAAGATLTIEKAAPYTIGESIAAADATVQLFGSFTLTGTVSDPGGTVALGADGGTDSWINSGVVSVANGQLVLDGNETVKDLGSLELSNSELIYATGTLDNTGGTLGAADAELHGITLEGISIVGGTLDAAGLGVVFGVAFSTLGPPASRPADVPDYLAPNSGQPNTLDAVTVIGGLTLGVGAVVLADGSAVYTDAAANTLATIDVTGTAAVSTGTIGFDGTAGYTIDQPLNVNGGVAMLDDSFVLKSTITQTGGTMELGANTGVTPSWTNDSTITATGALVEISGNETVGKIGDLALSGGTLEYIAGTLDNSGLTLNGADTSLLGITLDGGTIEGGTIDPGALGLHFGRGENRSVLDNVTVLNNLTVEGYAALGGTTTVFSAASGSAPGTITINNFGRLDYVGAGPSTLENNIALNDGELGWVASFGTTPETVDVTIASGVAITGDGDIADDGFFQTATTLTNAGTIDANTSGELQVNVNGFGNSGLLEASGGATLAVLQNQTAEAWTNSGTIIGDNATSITLAGVLDNTGLINVTGGTLLIGSQYQTYDPTTQLYSYVSPTWTNSGTINATNVTLEVEGDEVTADFGDITRTNTFLYFVGGTFDNRGETLDGSQASIDGLRLAGGTIEGGAIQVASAFFSVGGPNAFNTASDLDNVTLIGGVIVNGELNVTGTTEFLATAGTTTPGAITVDSRGILAFAEAGPQTLDNGISLAGGTLTWTLIKNLYYGTITDVVTIASGAAITGFGEIEDNRSGYIDSLTNDGTIVADYGFENITIGVATFDNQGLLEATNAGSLIIGMSRYVASAGTLGYPTFINTGTIEANHGTVLLEGDETVADLGLIENIAGTLDYAGGTLENAGGTLNGADASLLGLQMFGAEIEGGTLDQTPLQLGFAAGTVNTLDNVAVINNLTLSGTVLLTGSSAVYANASANSPGMIDVNDGQLVFEGAGPFTLTNDITLETGYLAWSGGPSISAASTVTIAAGVRIDGSGELADSSYFGDGGTDDLTNLGTIEASGFDAQLVVNLATFTNSGTLIADDASIFTVDATDFTNFNDGTLTGGTYVSDSEATFAFVDQYNSLTITTDAADIVLTGTAAFSALETTLTSVTASGVIEADDGAAFGAPNTLSVAGTVLLGGGTLSETFINLLAGATLTGHGAVNAPSGLALNAPIDATGGVLELNAPMTGAGSVDVAASSAVQFDSSATQAVDLVGADGTVVLGAGANYSGTVHGFAAGDLLVIDGFNGSLASYADNQVVVSNATAAVTVDIVGNFATDAFSATVPVPGETVVQLVQGPTLSVTAPTSELDNPGTVIAISGVTLTDGVGATVTVDISDQYGVLSATAEDGGIAQGNGTGSLVLSGALAAVNAELKTLQYRAPGIGQTIDTIVVTATDDTSGMATGLIDVTIDQPPTIALPAAAFEPVGTQSPVTGLGLTKPDPFTGEIITVTISDHTGLLAATVSGSGTVTGDGSTTLVLSGSLANVNTEMGSVTFDGTVNDQLSINADDGRGGVRAGFVPVYVNLPPAVSAPGTAAAIFGATVPVPGVSINDPYGAAADDLFTVTLADSSGTLSATAVAGASVGGSGTGTLSLTGTLSSINTELSSLQYTAGTATSDAIVVSVSDGHGETGSGTIDMAVAADVPPTTKVPATAVVTALTADTLGTLAITDSDALATSKFFTVIASDATGTLSAMGEFAGGVAGNMSNQLTLTGDISVINSELSTLQYTGAVPGQAANATAADTVTLQTSDGYGGSDTQEIAVTIDQVPYAAPQVTVPASAALQAGTATTLGTISVTDSFAQVTGATLDVSVSDLTGTLAATASGGGVIGSGSSQLLLTGSLADVNAELASLTYTGAPPNTALDETAADSVFVQAQDGRGGASAQQQIAVTVSPSGGQPYDEFLNAVGVLTALAEANPNASPELNAAALAVYVAAVSGAIGSAGGTLWQAAYDASSRAAGTVDADIAGTPTPAQSLSDSLGLFDSVVAGTLGAIVANAPQSATDAIEAAALALTADVSAGGNTRLPTDLATLYGAIAAAAGGTLSQAQWQTALNGSTAAANTLATAVSEGATPATLLTDAAALFDSVISNSLTAIGGSTLGQAYSTGGATLGALAGDINGGAAASQVLGDLSGIYNVVITASSGATVASGFADAGVSATALANYTAAFGASSGLLSTIAGGGSASDIYNSTRSVFISTLPASLGPLNGPGVQQGLDVVTTLQTALANYVAAKVPSSQYANLSAVGTSFLSSIFGAPGDADWTQYTNVVDQAVATDGPAISGQTSDASSAESDFLDKVLTAIFTLAEAQSPAAATAIDNALTTTLADENAGNGNRILADLGTVFSSLTTAAASSTGSINAALKSTTADQIPMQGDIDAFVNVALPGLSGVAINYGVPVLVLFVPSLAGIVPYAALLGAGLVAFSIVDFFIRAVPPSNPYRRTWNSLKRNPIWTISHAFGSGHGDTHLTTYDGLYYNFQAVGEFVLSKSTVAGDAFQVQIRLQPWFSGASVSVITQAAVALGGTDKLTFDSTRGQPVYYDGHAMTLTTGVVEPLGAATVEQLSASSWQVQYATGESVSINEYGSFLDVDTALPGNMAPGSVEGLLGNDNGNPQDDLVANGTILAQPLSSAQLYTEFADAWRVTTQSSLLDYGVNQSTLTFTDRNFPSDSISLSSLPASVLENAASLVAAAGITDPAAAQGAIEDYLLTGDTSFIAADAAGQNVEQPTVVATVTQGSTSSALGIGVVDSTVTLATTGSATPVQFTIYLTGAEAAAETVTYAVQAGTADLGASAFAGDVLPAGTASIAAGQVSTTITVDVLNSALGALPASTVEVGIASTNGTPVAAPDASVAVVNSQPVAGNPAVPEFVEITSVGTLSQSGTVWTLDLGSYYRDTVFTDAVVDIVNAATGTADVLSGVLSSGAASAISFSSGLAPVHDLLPGAVDPLTVAFDTTQIGTFDTQLVLAANDSNGSGYSASLGSLTLDVTGDVMACFLMGTRILTDRGEVAVEALRDGDLVVTLSGALRPIVWIGSSAVDAAKAPPIRIFVDAFGEGVPHRDLLVSADHAIAVGSALVPAYLLVNGATVVRERVGGVVSYFHVELQRHDILLAEGLAAESYLDTGNRGVFANSGSERHHAADAFAAAHQIKTVVDLLER